MIAWFQCLLWKLNIRKPRCCICGAEMGYWLWLSTHGHSGTYCTECFVIGLGIAPANGSAAEGLLDDA